MAVVVIGGHSRNVGKTSVVAGLISALREFEWTAIKITQFGHGVCSVTAEACGCALNDDEHSWSVDEELDRSGETDTSRFLVAGAKRVYWARTKQGRLANAVPALRKVMDGSRNTIIESNSVMKFIRPELYLTVLDLANDDFKDSAREFLDRADAVILQNPDQVPDWKNVSLKPVQEKPLLVIHPPEYVNAEVVDFVKSRLALAVRG